MYGNSDRTHLPVVVDLRAVDDNLENVNAVRNVRSIVVKGSQLDVTLCAEIVVGSGMLAKSVGVVAGLPLEVVAPGVRVLQIRRVTRQQVVRHVAGPVSTSATEERQQVDEL